MLESLFQTITDLAKGTAILYGLMIVIFFIFVPAALIIWQKAEDYLEKRNERKNNPQTHEEIMRFYAKLPDGPPKS